ncbi:MAG: HEPN domain-containing protein [Acidobacteriota bacterium]
MERTEVLAYWLAGAEEDRQAAAHLLAAGHYHWSLFLAHLAIEKMLKAAIAKTGVEVPFTHDLVRLARTANLTLTEDGARELNEITAFNIAARYDDYSRSFFLKATREFAQKWLSTCQSWFDRVKSVL